MKRFILIAAALFFSFGARANESSAVDASAGFALRVDVATGQLVQIPAPSLAGQVRAKLIEDDDGAAILSAGLSLWMGGGIAALIHNKAPQTMDGFVGAGLNVFLFDGVLSIGVGVDLSRIDERGMRVPLASAARGRLDHTAFFATVGLNTPSMKTDEDAE